jgi:hypothetical protein
MPSKNGRVFLPFAAASPLLTAVSLIDLVRRTSFVVALDTLRRSPLDVCESLDRFFPIINLKKNIKLLKYNVFILKKVLDFSALIGYIKV